MTSKSGVTSFLDTKKAKAKSPSIMLCIMPHGMTKKIATTRTVKEGEEGVNPAL
jgi:hypothetical protein